VLFGACAPEAMKACSTHLQTCRTPGWTGHRKPAACVAAEQKWLAKAYLDASAARLSDTAELENGLRQSAVEASRAIVPA
jgi:hypothetical protein